MRSKKKSAKNGKRKNKTKSPVSSKSTSRSNKREARDEYEVFPIIEYDENGRVDRIRASRKMTVAEVDSIGRGKSDEYSHVHPDVIQMIKRHYDAEEKKRKSHVFKKRVVYFLVWLYLLISVSIVTPDVFLIHKYFDVSVLLYSTIRFFFVTLILMLIWVKVGHIRMLKTIGSFLAFPVYPGLWGFFKSVAYYFPKSLVASKSYYFLYVYMEFVVRLVVKFRPTLITVSAFCLGFIFIVNTSNFYLVVGGMISLAYSQFHHLRRRWNELFGPLKIFQITMTPIKDSSGHLTLDKIDRQVKEVLTKEKKGANGKKKSKKSLLVKEIEQYVLYNEVLNALDEKLKNVLASQSYLKHLVVRSFYSLLFAVVVFGGINYGLYKISSQNFEITGSPNLFNFMYYSFFTVFSEGVGIEPLTDVAKFIRMAGVLIGAIINFLILAVYFTVVNDKYKENLKGITMWTTSFSSKMNSHMNVKFQRDGEANKDWLLQQGSELAGQINSIRRFFKTGKIGDKK